ncbi:YebC/PmpR family DNA-binding transcriptional regulator [Pseudenhygromyxa sp. WMMC2535]|uniref:YebC/PmpR family DNA-binding transcriptional regulator n=1 Tax=Pseudenhygromyxa sp. WMMC2535 TaxID=2712867 RepID=UPI001555FC61|nr:YebC/PmpR family DNA-binding transcriptional regulator [Pseudenhygromyxa sp. WMMC2535]NVB40689.1 YebC/PmpR family DNA-binding transcriptional regulator [Pseudenhygromyxa sp. WMMC2535]
MGRTFENRKLAMAKRGARDAKAFTRCARQISMAVKAGGPDPDNNTALRRAVQNARGVNMPKDKIQGAIDRAAGVGDAVDYQEVLYEGYGPHGIAMIVEAATDNPTRTVANVRSAFKKKGGNLGSSGSVAFMFDQFGYFKISPSAGEVDELELELIDHGLEQLEEGFDDKGEDVLVLRCARDDFGNLQSGLEGKGIEVVESGFEWVPQTTTELGESESDEIMALIEKLEADDDVQRVYHNLE